MRTTRVLLMAVLAVLLMTPLLLADVQVGAQLRITPRPRADLEVYVWPDRGMDGVYYPGDYIRVNVEVTRDAFLILYNIDTRGRLHMLFPASPWDDNFVAAGEVITFPRRWDDYDWTVDGPPGTEYIQAIASEIPIGLPEWPIYMKPVNSPYRVAPELRDFCAGYDRYAYIDVVNREICGRYYDWCATDVATFQVRSYPRYHRISDWDPWPDVFYGEIYIGWPVGARIYVDGIYIGIAPCWIPRHYTGRRVITCYDGPRLIRRHEVHCFPKRDYYVNNRFHDSRAYVYKKGRSDAYDHFRYEKDSGKRNRYRVYDRNQSWDDDHDRSDGKNPRSHRKHDDDVRQKQDIDRWRDYDLGKAGGKSSSRAGKSATSDVRNEPKQDVKIVKRDRTATPSREIMPSKREAKPDPTSETKLAKREDDSKRNETRVSEKKRGENKERARSSEKRPSDKAAKRSKGK